VDIWAVGIVAYLILSCALPFDRELTSLPKRSGEVRTLFELKFPEGEWLGLQSAQELIRGMLHVEPAERWNAQRCLQHPFLTGELFGARFTEALAQPTHTGRLGSAIPNAMSVPSSLMVLGSATLIEEARAHGRAPQNSI
jgi:serine/threonine protein kinase